MDKRVIITIKDLKDLRPLAELDGARWEQFAVESQDQDLRPILGDALYYDFMTKWFLTADPMYTAYQELLNGKVYTLNGQSVYFDGLRPMVGYFTLARLVQNNPINITRYGVVTKIVPQSQNVEATLLRQVISELRSNAITYKNQVDLFLCENQTTYALFLGSDSAVKISFKMFKG